MLGENRLRCVRPIAGPGNDGGWGNDEGDTRVTVIGAEAVIGAPAISGLAVFSTPTSSRHGRPALSEREVQVLLAWLAADSKEEAAARLYISASTVSTHIARIRAKYASLGRPAPTKAHLLARALQDGHTTLPEW